MFKMASGGLERWFVVKSTCWYYRGLGFSSWYAHGHSVTTVPGTLTLHSDFHGLQAHIWCIYVLQCSPNTNTHKIFRIMRTHGSTRQGEVRLTVRHILHSKGLFVLIVTVWNWKTKEAPWQTPDCRAWGSCWPLQHSHGMGAGGLGDLMSK